VSSPDDQPLRRAVQTGINVPGPLRRALGVDRIAGDAPSTGAALDLVDILSAIQETAYVWNLTDDGITWERNAGAVLGVREIASIATGSDFQFLIAPEHSPRRQEAVAGTKPEGAGGASHYRAQYRFTPGGRRSDVSLWLEDHGHCRFDAEGRPVEARGIVRVINERYEEEQRLLYRSDHDELTGQLNRIRLTEALETVVTRATRTRQSCAFLIVAVNNLAMINETFGFDAGDAVLAATARMISSRLRGGDSIGRYSSNKFGIILNDCGPGAMRVAADRFVKAVRETPIVAEACQLSATVSIGGVLIPDQAHNVNRAVSQALQALDKAKAKRQDGFVAYEASAVQETERRRNIMVADNITSALDQGRMLLALQPIVCARTHQPDFYECLLRIEREDGTIVSAGEFIPVAEQIGLSRLIDRRTLELAVDVLKHHPDIRLSLNVSGLTASDHEWLVALHKLTGGRRPLTERLVVEITETAAIHDLGVSAVFVDTLKELGCRVAIDDFGAGYTSFKNLKALKVDMVKIDGSFVRNLANEPSNGVFIKTLVEIAETFGLQTVAEWVSDEATARILTEAGITHLQGFLFGQPLMVAELEAVLREGRRTGAIGA
jgi:diguanylate cyclase (GGDEF)-like protein